MRILHIIPTLGCGGAEILLGNIAIEQARIGCKVKIILLEPFHFTYPNYFLKDKLESLVEIQQVDLKMSYSLRKRTIEMDYEKMDEIIKEFSPDVIHSHLFQAELVARYKVYKNVKYISHCHNNMDQLDLFANKSLNRRISDFLETRWLIKKYKKCNNVFVSISKNTQEYFEKKLPNKLKKNVFLHPNAINTSYYYSDSIKSEEKCIELISVGNLLPNKGHFFLIDAVSKLIQEGFDIRLTIVGFGPLHDELQNKIRELNLENMVFLSGNVPNVNDYLSKAHIYVHAAYKEGFGLVLVEAMASGLPIVTTDGGGNRDLIREGYNGYLIQERNINLFTDKLKLLINDTEQRKEIGANARQFSLSFDIIPYVAKLNEIYKI